MEQSLGLVEVPGLLQNKIYKRLLFSTEGLTIQKPLSYDKDLLIPAVDIAAFRYKVKWISGYKFTFGRQYVIEIQDFDKKTHTIKLGSYYGIRLNTYHDLWLNLLEQLWQHYFINILNYYSDLYQIRLVFDLAGVKFHQNGISWDNNANFLFWHEIAVTSYNNYFMIYNAEEPKQHKSCSFANDWNAIILQSLLKKIVEEQISFRNSSV